MSENAAGRVWEWWGWPVLIFSLGLLAAVVVSFRVRSGTPGALRLAGLFLELLGLLAGGFLLSKSWVEYGNAHGLFRRLRDAGSRGRRALRRAWHRMLVRLGLAEEEPEHQVVTAGTAKATAEAGSVGISQTAPPERDLEDRVEHLEEQVEHLHGQITDMRKEASRRAHRLEEKLRAAKKDLRKARRRLRNDLEEQVRDVAVGSLRWEWVALGWFVAGVLATAWAGVLSG